MAGFVGARLCHSGGQRWARSGEAAADSGMVSQRPPGCQTGKLMLFRGWETRDVEYLDFPRFGRRNTQGLAFGAAVTNSCREEANAHFAGPADLPGAYLPCGPVRPTGSISLVGEKCWGLRNGSSQISSTAFLPQLFTKEQGCAVMESNS